jgi:hypothetical protein
MTGSRSQHAVVAITFVLALVAGASVGGGFPPHWPERASPDAAVSVRHGQRLGVGRAASIDPSLQHHAQIDAVEQAFDTTTARRRPRADASTRATPTTRPAKHAAPQPTSTVQLRTTTRDHSVGAGHTPPTTPSPQRLTSPPTTSTPTPTPVARTSPPPQRAPTVPFDQQGTTPTTTGSVPFDDSGTTPTP